MRNHDIAMKLERLVMSTITKY